MTVAFVAGATGYTGRSVVETLRAHRVATIAHVRPDSPRLADWRRRFESLGATVDVTPWETPQVRATMLALRPTHVFALLGTTRARRRRAEQRGVVESYETVDLGLTAMLVEGVAAAGSARRFVYLSAVGVREKAGSRYLEARWRAESLLRASGIPYTIARPSFITGSDRDESRPVERVSAAALDAFLAVAGALGARALRDRFRSTTAAELARALVRIAFDPATENAVVESEQLRG